MAVADSVEQADSDNYPEIFWFIVYSSAAAERRDHGNFPVSRDVSWCTDAHQ